MQIAVIGGGASGLMAALTAARSGHAVTLYERQARVGRKLLATGNGRCNLSNTGLGEENYHGAERHFVLPALEAFPVSETLDFFRSLGLLTVTEPSGRVYPRSDQAGSVVDVLRFSVQAAGAQTRAGEEVLALHRQGGGFLVETASGREYFDRVIVCCGGLAGEKLGGTKSGYTLLASLGHSRTKLFPSLVQLKTENTFVRSLKGVRSDAEVTLLQSGKAVARSAGEVQFTDYGVSGPAIFEISREASVRGGKELLLQLDLLRGVSESDLTALLRARCRDFPDLTTEDLLTGILHNRLGRTVIRAAGFALTDALSALDAKTLRAIAHTVKCFTLPVLGTLSFDSAQVTCGGISTAEFKPETLESRLVPGLYAAGEVLDVDGDCGGYNLQWAWASGRLAGRLL